MRLCFIAPSLVVYSWKCFSWNDFTASDKLARDVSRGGHYQCMHFNNSSLNRNSLQFLVGDST